MIRTTTSGFDGFQKRLKQMADGIEQAKGRHEVPLSELFHPGFMRRHSRHGSIQELFDAGGFKVESMDDFAAIPDAEWEREIRSSTDFADWKAMQEAAAAEWFHKRMGLS